MDVSTLLDMRNVPAMGRIGDPDDILGTVLVKEGKVSVPGKDGFIDVLFCPSLTESSCVFPGRPIFVPKNAVISVSSIRSL